MQGRFTALEPPVCSILCTVARRNGVCRPFSPKKDGVRFRVPLLKLGKNCRPFWQILSIWQNVSIFSLKIQVFPKWYDTSVDSYNCNMIVIHTSQKSFFTVCFLGIISNIKLCNNTGVPSEWTNLADLCHVWIRWWFTSNFVTWYNCILYHTIFLEVVKIAENAAPTRDGQAVYDQERIGRWGRIFRAANPCRDVDKSCIIIIRPSIFTFCCRF